MSAAALENEANRLRNAARSHFRAARRERRRGQALMEQLDTLIASARAQGIDININRRDPGGQSGNHESEAQAGGQA